MKRRRLYFPFRFAFSRQGRAETSFALLSWLNENVPLLLCAAGLLLCSCDATRYLGEGETILRKVKVESASKAVNPSEYRQFVRQEANARWFSLVKVPLGLYCLSPADTTRSKGRFWRRIGEAPVVYDTLLTEASRLSLQSAMISKGFLHAEAYADTVVRRRRVDVTYRLYPGDRYYVRRYHYVFDSPVMEKEVADLASATLLRDGQPLDLSTLSDERSRIVSGLQDKGYYRLNKEFVRYSVDTLSGSQAADVTLLFRMPPGVDTTMGYQKYRYGRITIEEHKGDTPQVALVLEPSGANQAPSTEQVGAHYAIRPKVYLNNITLRPDSIFSETFFAELNIAGIGRFLFACVSDSKYWGEDIRILLQRNGKSKQSHTQNEYEPFEENDSFKPLSLNAVQTCLLYCLENILVQYDILHTQKPEVAENKALWLNRWRELLLRGFGIPSDQADKLFVEDEDVLYNGFFQLSQDKSNWGWFYLLTQELALFKPYYPLGCSEDKAFRKLKLESNYVEDRFIRRQTIVSQAEVDAIVKTYFKYDGYVSGSTKNKIIGASVTAVVAVATGGMALTFAPAIAAAIAGEAVVGLHGAALTSASLAFVGGGSLAAGGFGMAGGTAIITGGGALLGLAGSGSVSAATMMLQAPSKYWVRQGAKLLTYSNCVLCDYLNEKEYAKGILHQIEFAISNTEDEIKSLKTESNDLNKEILKKTEEYLKYLKRCQNELQRLIKG